MKQQLIQVKTASRNQNNEIIHAKVAMGFSKCVHVGKRGKCVSKNWS